MLWKIIRVALRHLTGRNGNWVLIRCRELLERGMSTTGHVDGINILASLRVAVPTPRGKTGGWVRLHVGYILAWVRGFRFKIANFSCFFCPPIPERDLDKKETTSIIEVWPESLGAMLEYWCIERGLFGSLGQVEFRDWLKKSTHNVLKPIKTKTVFDWLFKYLPWCVMAKNCAVKL